MEMLKSKGDSWRIRTNSISGVRQPQFDSETYKNNSPFYSLRRSPEYMRQRKNTPRLFRFRQFIWI